MGAMRPRGTLPLPWHSLPLLTYWLVLVFNFHFHAYSDVKQKNHPEKQLTKCTIPLLLVYQVYAKQVGNLCAPREIYQIELDDMRPRTFRPQPKTFVAFALAMVGAGIFGAILFSANQQRNGSGMAIPGFCLVLYVVASVIASATLLRNLLLTQLTVDETRLIGQVGNVKVDVGWDEIRVIRYENNKLTLATLDQTYTLPLEQLDGVAIWQTIQPLVRPQALSPTAYQEHPAHQALITFRQQVLADENQIMRLRYPAGWQIFIWTLGLTLTALVIYGLITGVSLAFTLLFGFWAVMLLAGAFLSTTQVELTPKQITMQNPFRTKTMLWAEVDMIKAKRQGGDWVLYKGKQRLHIPGSLLWFGQNRQRIAVLMDAQLWAQSMSVHENNPGETIYIRQQDGPGN
jgi:hypothetical protein